MAEALVSLLKEHTEHLREIHLELGSDNARINEQITALYDQLTQTIATQRNSLEEQLATVHAQIQEVRDKYMSMQNALGEDASSTDRLQDTSETLSEWRLRIEGMVKTIQKQHSTRSKTMVALFERLQEYCEILGSEWRELKNLPNPANRCNDLRIQTLEHWRRFENECEAQVRERRAKLNEDLTEIMQLWAELGIVPSTLESNVDRSEATPEDHLEASIVLHFSNYLEERVEIPPSVGNLQLVANKREALESERSHREDAIQTLYEDLYSLWTKMDIPEEETEAFVEKWKGIHETSIQAYKDEHERMLAIKAENTALFIARERQDISSLWDALYYSPSDREKFESFYSKLMSEETLEQHETYKHQLEKEKEEKAPILKTINKYFELLDEMKSLEAAASDPTRLTGKGVRGDPGRLLREEKSRKRVQREKPKLEKDLLAILPKWEEERGCQFFINGISLLEDLLQKMEAEKAKTIGKRTRSGTSRKPDPANTTYAVPLKPEHTGNTTRHNISRSQIIPGSTIKRQLTGTSIGSVMPSAKRMRTVPTMSTPCPKPFGQTIGNSQPLTTGSPSKKRVLRSRQILQTPSRSFRLKNKPQFRPRPSTNGSMNPFRAG